MLRHLRMTPPTKEVPKAEGRIFGLFHDWIHPLYRYRIAHCPTPRDRVCACAYPLFTLRSARRSPYDEPTMLAAMHETIYVDSRGKSTSPPVSEMPENVPASKSTTAATSGSSTHATPTDVSAAEAATSPTASPAAAPTIAGSHASAFLSSFGNLPSLKARWAIRRRRGGGRLATTAAAAAPSISETCYRCDICDGLQRSVDDDSEVVSKEKAATADAGPSAATSVNETVIEEDEDEEEDDASRAGDGANNSGEERYGHTTSTDIANTAMEDADVAELRHLDPFHVEVFGKPSWASLLKRATREVQQQLTRCGLRKRDASRYAAQATANSEVARHAYRMWVRAEAQRVREEQRRSMQPAYASPETSASPLPPSSATPSLTLSAEQRAIVKAKLDTLHLAAYLARYAIAAYGLPYELNFFTSVRELTRLSAEPHSRYVCANSEEQLESMRRMLQGEEPEVLLECVASRYSLRVGQPCWSLFLDHAAQRVVLSFRGSLTAADMVVDVMEGYAYVNLERDSATSADTVSAPSQVCTAIPLGFYKSVVEAGSQLLPILRTIHAQYSGYTLCVTGHSLGGIQASVFHLLYCGPWKATLHTSSSLQRRAKASVCPFATDASIGDCTSPPVAPASAAAAAGHVPFTTVLTCTLAAAPVVEKRVVGVMNAWLAAEEKKSGSRLVAMSHGMDLVTRLQVHSLQETFLKAYSATPTETPKQTASSAAETDAAATAAVLDKSAVPLLAIPGSMYNVTAGTRRRYLLSVPLTAVAVREQIIMSAEAVLQHFPCLYLRSFAELLTRYEAKWNALKATAAPVEGALDAATAAQKSDRQED